MYNRLSGCLRTDEMKRTVSYIVGTLLSLTALAQPDLPLIDARGVSQARETVLERDSILIGDQVWWKLPLPKEAWEQALTERIEAPRLPAALVDGVEALSQIRFDTLYRKKKIQEIEARVRVTSFDSGAYLLPYVPLYLKRTDGGTDTLWYKGRVLKVNTIPIDTTTYQAYDIKGQMLYPVTAAEVFGCLGVVLALAALVWFVVRMAKRRKKHLPLFGAPKPKEPAHIVALRSLDRIKSQELWKHNKVKQYYTQLTDTLRVYLCDRWNIQAMEQTSAEMLDSLTQTARTEPLLTKEAMAAISDMLSVSDLAKFAKHTPTEQENIDALQQTVRFVTATAPAGTTEEGGE